MGLSNMLLVCLLLFLNLSTIYLIKKLMRYVTGPEFLLSLPVIFRHWELYLIIVTGASAVGLYMYLTAKTEISRFVPILTGTLTLLVALMGIVIFRETLTAVKVLGLIFIFAGIILLSR